MRQALQRDDKFAPLPEAAAIYFDRSTMERDNAAHHAVRPIPSPLAASHPADPA